MGNALGCADAGAGGGGGNKARAQPRGMPPEHATSSLTTEPAAGEQASTGAPPAGKAGGVAGGGDTAAADFIRKVVTIQSYVRARAVRRRVQLDRAIVGHLDAARAAWERCKAHGGLPCLPTCTPACVSRMESLRRRCMSGGPGVVLGLNNPYSRQVGASSLPLLCC